MTAQWFGQTKFPVAPIKAGFTLTLGKMLRPARAHANDIEVPYLSSASVQTRGIQTDPEKTMWASPLDVARYRVSPGDLMVCEGGDVGRSVLVTQDVGGVIFQNSVHRLRARPEQGDTRYLAHMLSLLHGSGYLDVLCNKATIRHLTADKLSALSIPLPVVDEQRRIADFLDDQVSRIDEVIRLRRLQIDVLNRRADATFDAALADRGVAAADRLDFGWGEANLPASWRVGRLSQVLRQLTNGFVGPTRDILVDDGIRYIQGTHIKEGTIDFQRRPFFVRPEWHAARPRIHLRAGDVLIVQTGDIGRVAVVPPDFGAASCHALQIARVHEHVLSGEYLGAYLSSTYAYNALLSRATGALHPHLEGGIRDVPILLPPPEVQAEMVSQMAAARHAMKAARYQMNQQVDVMTERKRSLISAAVTGEFDLSTASGRGVVAG